MTIKLLNPYFFLFAALCLTKISAASINYELLNPTVKNFSSRIVSGSTIDVDEIKEGFDFIPYDSKSIKWDPKEFSALIEQTVPTVGAAFEKLGHNRFNTFVNDCKILFNKGTLEEKEGFALFILLRHVQHNIDYFLKDVETIVESESRIPDEQFSFLFASYQEKSRSSSVQSATSTQHISVCESASEDSDHRPATTDELDDVTFTSVSLDARALQPSSFAYYQKNLPDNHSPLCITCNLQSLMIDKMGILKEAIQEINATKNLREIIFTNGSSRKFNLLFDFLRDLSEPRTHDTPITIVYSTTSESQKAYKKLSTLRGIVHNAPDVRGLTDPTRMKRDSMHTCQRVMSDFSDDSLEVIDSILGIKHRPENPI